MAYLATTYAELTVGLGGQLSIPAGSGMLFDLGSEQTIQVTTVPMLFPLDIAFFSEEFVTTEVYLNIEPGYLVTSLLPARYFLEVSAGELEGIESGDTVNIDIIQVAQSEDWMTPVVSFAAVLMVGSMMAKMVKNMAASTFGKPKESPKLYGPRGEKLLPATNKGGSFVISHDHMGNLIITHTERTGEVFLQFESDREIVYDILKKWELKEVDKGWSVQVRDTEPRASNLGELWASSAQPARRQRKDELEFLPDSPAFLAYTIEDIGYREKIDGAFQAAIARAKRR